MPVDSSIYSQLRAPDIAGAVEQGMKLKELGMKRDAFKAEQEKKAKIQGVYKSSIGADGQVDASKVSQGLGALGYGEEAMNVGRQVTQDKLSNAQLGNAELENNLKQINYIAQELGTVNDQPSWQAAIGRAKQRGIDVSQFENMPYDPNTVKMIYGKTLTAKDKLTMENDALNRKEAREERAYLHGVARQDKIDAKVDTQVQKLSDVLAPAQQIQSSLTGIEAALGFKLDDYDDKTGQVMNRQSGKAEPMKDLPGVSVPGLGRVSGFSTEARNLQTKAAKVFNMELKDRSGAAVTTPELERLKLEFGEGKYNSEPELVAALKQYKNEASLAMKNRQAGFMPEALAQYEKQGGAVLKEGGAKTVVKTQTNQKTGEKRVVYSDGSIEMIQSNVAGQ